MDGVLFQEESHPFYAHKEITALSVTPRLIDLRASSMATITTTVRGLALYPSAVTDTAGPETNYPTATPNPNHNPGDANWPQEGDLEYFVKLFVSCSPPGMSPVLSEVKIYPLPSIPYPLYYNC